MGLLTDPGAGRGKLTLMLEAHHGKLCTLLYFAGLVWFIALAHEQFNAATYFSENALLPGLVESEYDEDHTAKRLYAELRDEAARYPESIPYSWLLAKLGQLGLETYTHNFSLHYPLGPGTYEGKNVYAILRAPRGASTEALVLSTPYRLPDSAYPPTFAGIALLLSLAKFFRRQKYWAKDIIFLITEHEQLGAQAWLESYHQASCGQPGVLIHGDLPARAGAIQAAVNLELRSDRLSHVDVKVEGLNGQLPNLDLVNLVHRLCAMESVWHTFQNRENGNFPDSWREWTHSLQTLMSMVFTQATGMTNGNHGLFHRFGIEAVTLEGYEQRSRGGTLMFYSMGRVLEGVCRSLNNLLERFHQSFFFYLLSATDRYISIGTYMPALGLICGALLIRAFALWLRMHEEAPDSSEIHKEKRETVCSKHKKICQHKEMKNSVSGGPILVIVGGSILGAHVLGIIIVNSPALMAYYIPKVVEMNVPDSLFLGATIASSFLIVIGYILKRTIAQGEVCVLLNIAALLELATLLLAIAMHNFSLAMFCATIYTPTALATGAFKSRWLRRSVLWMWVVLHPFIFLTMAVLVVARINYPEDNFKMLMFRGSNAAHQALMFSVLDSMIYGSWIFIVTAGVFLPNWLLFWIVVN